MGMFHTVKNIHFVGIGGSGMSGIAEVLANSGYLVSGSDIKTSPVIEHLISLGIHVFIGHHENNVKASNAHVVVYSSAVSKHNPEIMYAQNMRLPCIHRGEMLAEMMRLKYGIIVAGTHGKTTTTSIMASVLTEVGIDPTIVIGGKLNSLKSGARLGQGPLFLAEADESDGSFLKLNPTVAVITNIDKDHLDHYGSFDNIIVAFESFISKVPFFGTVCLCMDDPTVQMIFPKIQRRVITYGLEHTSCDVTAQDIERTPLGSSFTPVISGKAYKRTFLSMPGTHNILNALASYAVAKTLEIDPNLVSEAISKFQGVLHRFTVLGTHKRVTVVDDYAHNPKKIATVLKGIREHFPTHEVLAVFQPHRYSRVKHQLEEFGASFSYADYVIITPIYAASEQPLEGINEFLISQKINFLSFNKTSDTTLTAKDFQDARNLILKKVKSLQDKEVIIITLGAGDVKDLGPDILKALKDEI
jgi:UDP-N-acetylmuramate--alanine ligase